MAFRMPPAFAESVLDDDDESEPPPPKAPTTAGLEGRVVCVVVVVTIVVSLIVSLTVGLVLNAVVGGGSGSNNTSTEAAQGPVAATPCPATVPNVPALCPTGEQCTQGVLCPPMLDCPLTGQCPAGAVGPLPPPPVPPGAVPQPGVPPQPAAGAPTPCVPSSPRACKAPPGAQACPLTAKCPDATSCSQGSVCAPLTVVPLAQPGFGPNNQQPIPPANNQQPPIQPANNQQPAAQPVDNQGNPSSLARRGKERAAEGERCHKGERCANGQPCSTKQGGLCGGHSDRKCAKDRECPQGTRCQFPCPPKKRRQRAVSRQAMNATLHKSGEPLLSSHRPPFLRSLPARAPAMALLPFVQREHRKCRFGQHLVAVGRRFKGAQCPEVALLLLPPKRANR
ncbi:uncharacterized protein LOC144170330 isoform X2 [Haemaphysalis longicornis]